MKNFLILIFTLFFGANAFAQAEVYLFAYTPEGRNGTGGLNFAWSGDSIHWMSIGSEHDFVKCDYGRWGQQKRMYNPFLFQDANDLWHCVWTLNENDSAFAYVSSEDLVRWNRQSYTPVMEKGNCKMIKIDPVKDRFIVSWIDNSGDMPTEYSAETTDFKSYKSSQNTMVSDTKRGREKVYINGRNESGTIHKVPSTLVDKLKDAHKIASANAVLDGETTAGDGERFDKLKPIDAIIKIDTSKKKDISNLLIGIFFEDINYAADGGLYAELIQNRDFEYTPQEREGKDPKWNSTMAWEVNGDATLTINTTHPIHPNNKNYASLNISNLGASIINEGFDGIAIKAGEKYDFSIMARSSESKGGKLTIRLIGKDGEIYGETTTKNISSQWKKYEGVITANKTISNASLKITPEIRGNVDMDMISLFPQNTFKGRKNGLRADLAQVIADMKPRFVRFPGGCVAHGDGLENMYRWKNTIGKLEERKPQRNIWKYHQSAGLGYYEYFQFCEDLGAEPLPVVAAGVPCQNSAHNAHLLGGQQGGIPMCDMDDYVQEVLDLIEWANGDVKTAWGKKRAQAGHPEPFNLKYIGIGNEDQITDVFEERFIMIFNAVKEKHPEITVIGTAGPFTKISTDYVEAWKIADKLDVPMLDEHYYQTPGWFINNQDYYDSYDRSKSKVYLGEYAAHLGGRPNTETALSEALYLTGVERNGDVVSMTSYAPLLAKEGHIQWSKDLIYFNNTDINPTVGYYVQKLYGENSGDEYIYSQTALSNNSDKVQKRIGISCVRDKASGDFIIKLVNMLPVDVSSKIELDGIVSTSATATKTVLAGNPDARNTRPVESTITVSENFSYDIPAYSFTVIRIKNKN